MPPRLSRPLPSCPPPPGSELRVVGGGSKNRLWRRIVADAFQLPLRFPAEPEAAALGAAMQAAAVHAGVPVAEFVESQLPPMGARRRLPGDGGACRQAGQAWAELASGCCASAQAPPFAG